MRLPANWGKKTAGLFLAVLVFLMTLSAPVLAKAPQGLQISPLRAYPSQKPGVTTTSSITLTNYSSAPLSVTLSTQTFKTTNADYDYIFNSSDADQWISFDQTQLTLTPQQKQSVNYQVNVPTTAAAGGYYIALIATVNPPATPGSVIEIKRVASLVYLEVGGTLIKQGRLINTNAPWFSFVRTIPVEVNVANTGNSHFLGRVQLDTSRWPGQQQLSTTQLENLVLPGTVRKLNTTVNLAFLPGIYRIKVNYATPQGTPTNQYQTILYMPLWFILAIIVGIIAVAGEVGWHIERRHQRYKK